MKKLFTVKRKTYEIFFTLILVLSVVGFYYLIYVPGRENDIVERKFRTLQGIDRNVEKKMDGVKTILNIFLEAYRNSAIKKGEKDAHSIQKKKNERAALTEKIPGFFKSGNSYFSISCDSVPPTDTLVFLSGDTSLVEVKLLPDGNNVEMSVFDSIEKRAEDRRFRAKAIIDIKECVAPLFRKTIFDSYLVFNDGKVLYEDFSSGLSYKSLDSLFNIRNGIIQSKVVPLETGGKHYMAFLQPSGKFKKNNVVIVGLVERDKFENEKRHISENHLLPLILIALFSLLLLPFFKLVFMGKRERISLMDIVGIHLSLMLLCSVVCFLLLKYTPQFTSQDNEDKVSLLANKISQNFMDEVRSDNDLLNTLDSVYSNNPSLQKRSYNKIFTKADEGDFGTLEKAAVPSGAVLKIKDALSVTRYGGQKVLQAFWVNKENGVEVANWSADEINYPHGNLFERGYFQDIKKHHTISFFSDQRNDFSIEPVYSWSDGKFKFVIAKNSVCKTDSLVACIACRMNSVINPVMPLGYQFAIIDREGSVVFHSDSTRNLNENLLDELVTAEPLKTSLVTRSHRIFSSLYNGGEYKMEVQPIDGLPYSIVIMSDQACKSSVEMETFFYTFEMTLSFFAFLSIELFIILLFHSRNSKLKNNLLDLFWMYPSQHMERKYNKTWIFNVCVTGLTMVFTIAGCSRSSYLVLPEFIFMLIIGSLTTSIYACFVPGSKQPVNEKKLELRMHHKTGLVLLVILLVTLFTSCYYETGLSVFFFTVLCFLAFFIPELVPKKADVSRKYLGHFRRTVFFKILLTSALPVFVFYMCGYNFEQHLDARLKLFDFARKIESHSLSESILRKTNSLSATALDSLYYPDSVWIDKISLHPFSIDSNPYSEKEKLCLFLLNSARLPYGNSCEADGFEITQAHETDKQYRFNSIFTKADSLIYQNHWLNKNQFRPVYLSASGSNEYHIPVPTRSMREFIFWLLLVSGLGIIYFLLKYASNLVFGTGIPALGNEKTKKKETPAFKIIPGIDLYFVQGLPGAGKTRIVEDALQADSKQYKEYSLINIPDSSEFEKENWKAEVKKLLDYKGEFIVLNHFEYNINDSHTSRMKLNLLEHLMLQEEHKKKIVLISTVEPSTFIDSLQSGIPDPGTDPKNNLSIIEDLERWKVLLGHYTNFYIPIAQNKPGAKVHSDISDPVVIKCIEDECRYGKFMEKIKTIPAFDIPNGHLMSTREKCEHVILTIQGMAHHFYNSIWSSLTREEQLAMFDLAEDGLMNPKNYVTINMLVFKGIIRREDGELKLMNDSFRNFILTNTNLDDMKQIEREINDSATWQDYRNVVFIILGVLVWFVISSNPDKFGHVLPLVSGIAAGIPTIIKLVTTFIPVKGGN